MKTSTSNLPTIIFLLFLCFGFKSVSQNSSPHTHGQWSPRIEFDIVPVAVANLPDGRLVTWSSKYHDDFDLNDGYTFTQIFDPTIGEHGGVLPRKVTETFHDMFCPGINNLADGRILVSGGSSDEKASIYDPKTEIWDTQGDLNIARGYQGAVTLSDGRAFTIGGSWDGAPEYGGRDGEVWSAETGEWTVLSGLPGDLIWNPNDASEELEGVYRLDNHAWLWAAPNGKVFHAGPGETMHWIDVDGDEGNGSYEIIGQRNTDHMSMNGNTVMFDIGKLLKVGGSASYDSETPSNTNSYVIDINNGDTVTVTPTTDQMEHSRVYVSSVALPNGEVLVLGGMDYAKVFSDDQAHLSAELFTPDPTGNNGTFTTLASMTVPRTYHSAAILLNDGRVFMGGGGLCGTCEGSPELNHLDAEVFSPPYLFNPDGSLAERPDLNAPEKAYYNTSFPVTATPGVTQFSFMRMSSSTHSINNEQRRVPVTFTENNGYYDLAIPGANLMPPGYYMLFAIKDGVPSMSEAVLIGPSENRLHGDNLLVEFEFFEGSGNLVTDTSGNYNHATIKERDDAGNEISLEQNYWSANGLSGNALEMDGMEFQSNSIVEIPSSASLRALTNQITVMAWINRNVGSVTPRGLIPNVSVFAHDYIGQSFFMGYHADKFKVEFWTESGGRFNGYTDEVYKPGEWQHFVATYDGEEGVIYVDGVEVYKQPLIGNLKIVNDNYPYSTFTLAGFYNPYTEVGLPDYNIANGITDELDGRMDKFKLYNMALSEEEILQIYNDELVIVDNDPCNDYALVYELNGKRDRATSDIMVRAGDTIGLFIDHQNTEDENNAPIEYLVKDPNGKVINHLIEDIQVSGEYTATVFLKTTAFAEISSVSANSWEPTWHSYPPEKAIDGSPNTFWHTSWSSGHPTVPHWISFELEEESTMLGFEYLPRQFNEVFEVKNMLNGTITEYEIYVSTTLDASGEPIWSEEPVSRGNWSYDSILKTVVFSEPVTAKYVRLIAISSGDNTGGNKFASAAEIRIVIEEDIECENPLNIEVITPKEYIFDEGWLTEGNPVDISNKFDTIEIVSGNPVIPTGGIICDTLIIQPGASLTIDSKTAKLTANSVILNSTSTSFASLIDKGYVTAPVIYNRFVNRIGTSAGGGGGNDLISSPMERLFDESFIEDNPMLAQHPTVSGQYAFAPFNVEENAYQNFNVNSFPTPKITHGVGYRVASVDASNPEFSGAALTFKGKITQNTVDVEISDAPAGNAWNLIGNPYPSYLDFEMFITENDSQLNEDSDGAYQAVYGYTGFSDTWTVWNQAVIEDPNVTTSIAPGQGFFVNAKQGGGIIRFTPEMRITGNTDDFIAGRPSKNIVLSKLKLSDSQKSDVTSIYFIDGTTRGLDRGYDAGTFTGVARDFLIYTNLVEDHSGTNIAIQSLPYDDFNEVTVPLGIKAKAGAELSISIDSLSTIPSTINVYLEDKQENTMVLLNKGSYTFTSTVDLNTAERFNIHYSSKPLSIDNLPSNDNIRIYVADAPKSIMILGQLKSATTASIYDLHGRLVLSKALNAYSTENAIDVSNVSIGVYIVKLSNDHQVKTQKVVIK